MEINYYIELVNFFIKHNLYDEKIFNYLNRNKIIVDYREIEHRGEIRCYKQTKNNILNKVWICVPTIYDSKTLLINIYIYMHAILLCKKLGKKTNDKTNNQILAMLYEKIYVEENPNNELKEYLDSLNEYTRENGPINDKIALGVQQELLEYYNSKNPNLENLQKKAKKLSRKYQRNNR